MQVRFSTNNNFPSLQLSSRQIPVWSRSSDSDNASTCRKAIVVTEPHRETKTSVQHGIPQLFRIFRPIMVAKPWSDLAPSH